MQKVILLKGLPASGKSTWAKAVVEQGKGQYKRINKDDLRAMLDGGKWGRTNEDFVLNIRDIILKEALKQGKNVIIDDTNLSPKHEKTITDIVNFHNYKKSFGQKDTPEIQPVKIEIKFFDVSVEECIKRDLQRPVSVGEKVIRDMYNKYLRPKPENIMPLTKLESVVICDIDGTLALMRNRNPFEWDKVEDDDYNITIRNLLFLLHDYHKIILFSGRDSVCREKTENWLMCKGIPYDSLYMRPQGDTRKDSIVKREMFDQYIRGKYNVEFVLDDRNQVVDMWRNDLGLTCFQVAEGNF